MTATRSFIVLLAASIGIGVMGGSAAQAQNRNNNRNDNRNDDQTERIVRKVTIGPSGRVTVGDISGSITVATGPGDDVAIEATKRVQGQGRSLSDIRVEIDSRPGRVDIRTEYELQRFRNNGGGSVDYKLIVPVNASVELHEVSGHIDVAGVKGVVRIESVSGDVRAQDTPRLEEAKSVSGDVSVSGITEGDVSFSSVSGRLTAMNVKARSIQASTVSGSVMLTDALCDRLTVRSVSGSINYAGAITQGGRYEVNTHSGSVRFQIPAGVGFDLDADTFSGGIRSDFQMTVGGDGRDLRVGRGPKGSGPIRATFGDGKADLVLRTFSGSIYLQKQ